MTDLEALKEELLGDELPQDRQYQREARLVLRGLRQRSFAAIERLEADNARLRDLLCLADEVLMKAIGAFPLPGNVLREACIKIRDETGPDYHHRKDRARAALQETSHDAV